MERARIRRLPVVKDGALVGMLSLGDVAVALSSKRQVGQALEEISASERTEELNRANATLKDYAENLEYKVKERTEELRRYLSHPSK